MSKNGEGVRDFINTRGDASGLLIGQREAPAQRNAFFFILIHYCFNCEHYSRKASRLLRHVLDQDMSPPPGDVSPPPGDASPPLGDASPPPGDASPPPGDVSPLLGDTDATNDIFSEPFPLDYCMHSVSAKLD